MVTTLEQYLEKREFKRFRAVPHYFEDGDFVTFFFRDERCYAKREDDLLTVYYSDATNEMVGCKLKGVRLLLRSLRNDFKVIVDDGDVRLSWLFLAALAQTTAKPVKTRYYELNNRAGDLTLNRDELPLAA